ncbi:MAG: hypothetical protein CVV25_08600 [Ignavibacteriae bacterium HGW-Ignavibacteriae-4]|jgi:hypothetical protein|nr:MAG: hypothetical protein CVV25_08600 [Ignavibacteriae bacterium HGW-Ignavibacteriae-4]
MKRILILILLLILSGNIFSQKLYLQDDYLKINAEANDPIYTTYAATIERSKLYGDKAYKLDYYSQNTPINYWGDQAGKFYTIWKVDQVVINKIADFYKKPVITASFPDMAILEYEPFKGIRVQETFFVYSSNIAVVNLFIENIDKIDHQVELYPILELGKDSLLIKSFNSYSNSYITNHHESRYRLISSLYKNAPYPTETRDILLSSFNNYSHGGYKGNMDDFYITIKTDFYAENRNDSLNNKEEGYVNFVSLHGKLNLKAGQSTNVKYMRGWQDINDNAAELTEQMETLKAESLQKYVNDNCDLFATIPKIKFTNENEKLVYLGSLNLVRGCMLPPTGKTVNNFYVFSRNPLWGWGHGHQVLHESLSMLSYVYLDSESAQGSQRVYIEQQGEDGLIAYRHGPRGLQDYPHYSKNLGKEVSTTSAPFFSWINWELYKVSGDKQFLEDSYKSGSKYVDWLYANRDLDNDGTFEWGPYGIIENVRDWYNAVFQVSADRYLDVDKEDISDELECLDLTLMVVKEMRSLAKMAEVLNDTQGLDKWTKQADHVSNLVNERMWDDSTKFYYSVNKEDHTFKFMTRDLRRQEIIGFLPLWAGVATKDRAEMIVKTLTDTTKFWRKYGVPTLAADDPWYSPYVDYCCKWNGPVWLLWDYMIFDGLMDYGYKEQAIELKNKMMDAVTTQLSSNHNFWESFSPDNTVLNSPSNYIWDSIMAKLLIDIYTDDNN